VKLIISITFLVATLSTYAQVRSPLRTYILLHTLAQRSYEKKQLITTQVKPAYAIPHYEIPKGAVFCRMEDKLTKATKVWIKVGVK